MTDTRFKPGQSGNPKGRSKGSRNKLGEAFLRALSEDFDKHGVAAIETVREQRPQDYVKVVASLLPKELNIRVEDEYSDAELDERIRQLAAAVSLEVGIAEPAGGEEAADLAQSTGDVPTIQ